MKYRFNLTIRTLTSNLRSVAVVILQHDICHDSKHPFPSAATSLNYLQMFGVTIYLLVARWCLPLFAHNSCLIYQEGSRAATEQSESAFYESLLCWSTKTGLLHCEFWIQTHHYCIILTRTIRLKTMESLGTQNEMRC